MKVPMFGSVYLFVVLSWIHSLKRRESIDSANELGENN